jgi:hypothetical protein
MSLDVAKLEKVRRLADGSIRARCPACAAAGHDKTGDHLLIRANGTFGCAVNPGDQGHRAKIWALVGDKTVKPVEVRSLGRMGREPQAPNEPVVIATKILGRLGRVHQSLAGRANEWDVQGDRRETDVEKLIRSAGSVPSVPEPRLPPDQAAWLPVARQVLAGEFENADRSTVESLVIGLRSITHPVCRQALARL